MSTSYHFIHIVSAGVSELNTSFEGVRLNAKPSHYPLPSNTRPNRRVWSCKAAQTVLLSSVSEPHTPLEGVRFKAKPSHYSLQSNTHPKSPGMEYQGCPNRSFCQTYQSPTLPFEGRTCPPPSNAQPKSPGMELQSCLNRSLFLVKGIRAPHFP